LLEPGPYCDLGPPGTKHLADPYGAVAGKAGSHRLGNLLRRGATIVSIRDISAARYPGVIRAEAGNV
jgi:hypothetical protein